MYIHYFHELSYMYIVIYYQIYNYEYYQISMIRKAVSGIA